MKSLILSHLLLSLAHTQSLTSNTSTALPPPTNIAANISAASYTITALPAVLSQPAYVFNCLIPIGLADPSGCDDVTNACACLIAPMDVLDVLTGCIQTVCKTSTAAYAATATSLYESYCQSAFGTEGFSRAFSVEAAMSTGGSGSGSGSASGSAAESQSGGVGAAETGMATPSATGKSGAVVGAPSV